MPTTVRKLIGRYKELVRSIRGGSLAFASRWRTIITAELAVAVLSSGSALPSPMGPILPDYFVSAGCTLPYTTLSALRVECGYQSPPGAPRVIYSGTAAVVTGPVGAFTASSPEVIAIADFDACDQCGPVEIDARAVLEFYFTILGPPDTFVTVDIDTQGSASASNGIASAAVFLDDFLLRRACSSDIFSCAPPGNPVAVIGHWYGRNQLQALTNHDHQIILDAIVDVGVGGSGAAFADPLISIDPSIPNADQYTLLFSPGIVTSLGSNPGPSSAPEPVTAGLLVAAMCALLAVNGRRRTAGWGSRVIR